MTKLKDIVITGTDESKYIILPINYCTHQLLFHNNTELRKEVKIHEKLKYSTMKSKSRHVKSDYHNRCR